jgi:hypothetical protein
MMAREVSDEDLAALNELVQNGLAEVVTFEDGVHLWLQNQLLAIMPGGSRDFRIEPRIEDLFRRQGPKSCVTR